MISLIIGHKGSGKTKHLIQMVFGLCNKEFPENKPVIAI